MGFGLFPFFRRYITIMGVNASFGPFESLYGKFWVVLVLLKNFGIFFFSQGQRWVPMLPNPNNQRQVVEETAQFLASVAILNKGHKSDLLIAENDKKCSECLKNMIVFMFQVQFRSEYLHCNS